MKKRLIINLLCAGIVLSAFFTGCKSSGEDYYQDGLSYYKNSDYGKAVECFQKAVENDSDNVSYSVYLGMSQLETGDYNGAMNTFGKVVIVEPSNRDAYRGLGIAYVNCGKYDEAIAALSHAVEYSKKNDNVKIDSMKYLATCYYETGQYKEAVDMYTDVISYSDKDEKDELYYLRGTCYIKLDDENNATLDYEKSLELNGTDYNLCCNMYYNFKKAGYVDRGESYLKRIIQAQDADSYLKGKTYYILEDYVQAEKYLIEAYDNGNGEAAYYLAMTYERKEDFEKAENLYKSYMDKHPEDYGIYNQYGAYLISRKEYEKALEFIEKGLKFAKEEQQQELLFNQAVCHEYMGKYQEAYQLFQTYLSKYPNDAAAKKELEFLSSR